MPSITSDPFADATSAGERTPEFWGQLEVEAEFVVLEKGRGKRPWIDGQDSVDARRTAMTFILSPIDAMNMSRVITREIIAQSSEWTKIVWPSAKACGVSYAGNLNNSFVRIKMVPSGRKWTNSQGEEVIGTTIQFVKVFPSITECEADFASRGTQPLEEGTASPQNGAEGNTNAAERKTAEMFLQALTMQFGSDRAALAQQIATTPLLSKYFTIDSPEVAALLGGK